MTTLVSIVLAMAFASPGPMPKRQGCVNYVGSAAGNDPDLVLRLQLCKRGAQVTGLFQISGKQSGWNERTVAGTARGAKFVLHDVTIIEDHPNEGWRFCLAERYDLKLDGDQLSGTYDSAACDDHGAVSLRRSDQ